MMKHATKTSTSPIISEHSEIAADDHIERGSPAKNPLSVKENITRSNPNQSKRKMLTEIYRIYRGEQNNFINVRRHETETQTGQGGSYLLKQPKMQRNEDSSES